MEYVDGKGFTLRNKYTDKYLGTNASAKYDTPTYFSFCTIGETTGIRQTPPTRRQKTSDVYSMQGVKVGTISQWSTLPRGIYVINGKKTIKQ